MRFNVQKLARLAKPGIMAAAILVAGTAWAAEDASKPTTQGAGAAKLTGKDASGFIKEAALANEMEIALANAAERKTQNSDVKEFARMMRKDHTASLEKLRPLAKEHGVAIDTPLDARQQKKIERLQQLSGTEFDKEYMKDMLREHQKAIDLYQNAAARVDEADVKTYAQTTLPVLRQHLQHAKTTAAAVGIDQDTISSTLKESDGAVGGTVDDTHKDTGAGSKQQNK